MWITNKRVSLNCDTISKKKFKLSLIGITFRENLCLSLLFPPAFETVLPKKKLLKINL